MELEKIKELIGLMQTNDLSELEIVDGETRIVLKRSWSQVGPGPVMVQGAGQPVGVPQAGGGEPAAVVEEPTEHLVEVTAPMVGTFYATQSPDSDPFVEVGRSVDEETVVCIIEAMKVMNEIKSGMTGTVVQTLAGDGASVEYGQPLFIIRPS